MDQSKTVYNLEKLEQELGEMQRAVEARAAFVIDGSGQILSAQPAGAEADAAVLGALAAANLAATYQLARLVDGAEHESARMLLIETATGGMMLGGAASGLALAVILTKNSPLGLARLMAQELTARLENLQLETELQLGDEFNLLQFDEDDGDEGDFALDLIDQLDELLG